MKNLFVVFIDSILYFFSLDSNPIKRYREQRRKKNDIDNMTQDWYNVGNDIRNAYEKYKSC